MFSSGTRATILCGPPTTFAAAHTRRPKAFAARNVLQPPSEEEILAAFTRAELKYDVRPTGRSRAVERRAYSRGSN